MKAGRPPIKTDDRKEKCGVTIKKSLVILAKEKAKESRLSFSEYVEPSIENQIKKSSVVNLDAFTAALVEKIDSNLVHEMASKMVAAKMEVKSSGKGNR